MRKPVLSLALSLVLFSGAARAAGPGPAFGPWVSEASQLLQATDQALADLGRLVDNPQDGLGARYPNSAPFRSSLALLVSVVDRLAGTLKARDPEYFALLDQGSVALGGMRVAWARVGVRNDAITANVRLASASYRLLRANYGLEGLRHRQGGDLTDAERRQFQRLQRTQRRLAADLERLRDQARRRKDSALAAELDRFHAQSALIAWAPLDLDSYLNALIATSEMRGEWRADAPYVKKAMPPQDWTAADQTVEDLWVDADIGKVFVVDLGKPGDEASPEPAAAPVAAEGAVQVYQAVESEEVEERAATTVDVEPVEEAEGQPEPEEPQAADESGVVEEEDLEVPETPEADAIQAGPPADAKPDAGEAAAAPATAKETKQGAKKDSGPAKAKTAKPAAPPAVHHPKSPGIS